LTSWELANLRVNFNIFYNYITFLILIMKYIE